MAIDTLLNGLVNDKYVTPAAAATIRAEINKAYAAVEEPNAYKPDEFRASLATAVASIRRLQ